MQQPVRGAFQRRAGEPEAGMRALKVAVRQAGGGRGAAARGQDRLHDERRVKPHIGRPADALAEKRARNVTEAGATIRAAAIYADIERLWHKPLHFRPRDA